MRLIGRHKLLSLPTGDPDTTTWVTNWVAELRDAHWKRPADVQGQFPKAQIQDDGAFVFPVPRIHVGIRVMITFPHGVALIVAINVLEAANGH